jgi:hypothetical protein
LFTESEIDPCEGLVDEALDRCQNVERLRDFGVTVGNNPLAEGAFSDKQLQTLNMTVEQVSTYIAGQAAAAGYDLTPEEAFQIVFGNVEFISDPMLDEQLGKTEGQTIRLRPSALDIVDTLVPAHELAHIFQNRLGETENKMFVQVTRFVEIIDNEGNVIGIEEKPEDQAIEVPASTPIVAVHYVIETGGRWYPFGMPIWEQDETGRLAQKRDEAGNLIWNIEPGTYIPARYDDNLQARISEDLSNSLFFNERRRETNPTEGFADTLAILTMRGRDLLFDDPRGKFFDEQMPYWIRSLIEPTRYPFPAPLNALEYENEDQDNADDEQ